MFVIPRWVSMFTAMIAIALMIVGCTRSELGKEYPQTSLRQLLDAQSQISPIAVRIRGCLSVTTHDITVLDCGTANPQVFIAPGNALAYENLIDFGVDNRGKNPEQLPVLIDGEFSAKVANGRVVYYMAVDDFQVVESD